ncbi:hypothetical protein C8R45DRAFT_943019 [Mycena sanguinolenta]|nr:hypothetical protein C8R45DRAFT_943019 [Mycena sanguinolenta]
MFATNPLILLLAASLTSATSPPIARTTTYQVCAVCPLFDTEGNAVSPSSGYGLTPPTKFCGFGDLGQNGFITTCFYDVRMPIFFAIDSYTNYRILVLLLREQSTALLDLFQSLRHRTASWLQSRGHPEIVAVKKAHSEI